jgi:predicted deacetylase
MGASDKRLLAAIHDVGPAFTGEVGRLIKLLGRHLGDARPALLVVPDHWGQAPIAGNAPFQQRLRDWHASGSEIFLHGWFHRDDILHTSHLAHFKAGHATAGEGEFLGLGREEALRRMLAGRELLEDSIGAPLAGFIAPAWLYGPGSRFALAEAGFAIAEDHLRVWQPADGRVLARGPAVTWASRSRGRIISSRLFAGLARHALAALPTMRVALHPGDVRVPALLGSIDRTLAQLLRGRVPAHYRDLLPEK